MDEELETLTREYLHGTLEGERRERLARRLEADPAALAEFVDQLQIHQGLGVLLKPGADPLRASVLREVKLLGDSPRFSREVVAEVKRRLSPFPVALGWGITGAAAALFLVVLGLVLFLPADAPFAGPYVAAATPGATLGREGASLPLARGMSLLPGDTLQVPAGGRVVLRYGTSSRIELGPSATGLARTRRGHEVRLDQGALAADVGVPSEGRILSFSTPEGTLLPASGWVSLRAAPDATTVEAETAPVAFTRRNDGARLEVPARHAARIEADARFTAVPLRRAALLVVGIVPLGPGDAAVRARLERLNFDVTVKTDLDVTARDAEGKALVAASATVFASETLGDVGSRLRGIPVPVLTWEPRLLFELGMIPGSGHGSDWAASPGQTSLAFLDPAHPLAAGFFGTLPVTTEPGRLSWGRARDDALRIATLAGDENRTAIFAYERGQAMPGCVAPARRVGFFLFEETPLILTREGWALFDAAVRWCASPESR